MPRKIDSHGIGIVEAGLDDTRWLFQFGPYGWDMVLVIGEESLDDALSEAIDYLAQHSPEATCDTEVAEEYTRAIADGCSEEEAIEQAEVDTTQSDSGHYISDWTYIEDPSRECLLDLQKRDPERRAKVKDPLAGRKPGNVARRLQKSRAA